MSTGLSDGSIVTVVATSFPYDFSSATLTKKKKKSQHICICIIYLSVYAMVYHM